MKLIFCTAYDLATESFGQPFTVNHTGQAVRSFTDEVNNPDSQVGRHHEDYELWQLGFFDTDTGEISPTKLRLIRGADCKKA